MANLMVASFHYRGLMLTIFATIAMNSRSVLDSCFD